MSQVFQDNVDFLKVLSKCSAKQRKAILQTADNQLLKALCECILNVLKETVPISLSEKQKLSRHKNTLITLAVKKVPFHQKKKPSFNTEAVSRVFSYLLY